MVYVEQVQDAFECPFAVGVLKYLCIDSNRVVLANMHGELDFAVNGIVFLDPASQEPDDDDG